MALNNESPLALSTALTALTTRTNALALGGCRTWSVD